MFNRRKLFKWLGLAPIGCVTTAKATETLNENEFVICNILENYKHLKHRPRLWHITFDLDRYKIFYFAYLISYENESERCLMMIQEEIESEKRGFRPVIFPREYGISILVPNYEQKVNILKINSMLDYDVIPYYPHLNPETEL